MDMQMLVEQQGETVKQVEDHMQTAVGHLEQGNTMIAKAIRSARATRHVRFFLKVSLQTMMLTYPRRKNGAV